MAKKEINSDISVDGQIMLTNVPNGTGNFLTYNLVNKAISQRTNAEVISDLRLITATNIASAYYNKTQLQTSGQAQVHWGNLTNVPTTFTPAVHNHDDRYYTETESDAKFVPYTGATQSVNLNTQQITSVGKINNGATYREVANYGRYYDIFSQVNKLLFSTQNEWWNGTDWTSSPETSIHIGENSGAFSKGGGVVNIGRNAGQYNNATNALNIGRFAGQNNTGINTNNVGSGAGQNNTQNDVNNFGTAAGGTNSGAYTNNFGQYAGENNTGLYVNNFGQSAGRYNTGNSVNNFGQGSGQYNLGNNNNISGINAGQFLTGGTNNIAGANAARYMTGSFNNVFGDSSGRYIQNNNNHIIGYNSFAQFKDYIAGNKTFDYTAIDTTAKTITIPSHGFGSANKYINLKFTQGTSAITGIANGNIIQVKIIDANTLLYSELLTSGQYRHTHNITSAGTGTGHIFTPQIEFFNVQILGSNLEPTKANQTLLGGGECLLPQSTVATIDADSTNKTLITKEWFTAKAVSQSSINTQLTGYATLAGTQTFTGTNTFNSAPIVPNGTLNGHTVNLGQLATANVGSATKLQTARTFTLGNTGKSFDGTANVSFNHAEIGVHPINSFADPATTLNLTDFAGSDRVNLVPNEWIDVALDSVGINTSFTPILEVSDDGTTWTQVTSVPDMFKFFEGGSYIISITQNYFRFTFRTADGYNSKDYIGFRTQSFYPGVVVNGFYECSQDGTTWSNRSIGNTSNVTNIYNTTLFKTAPQSNASYHRLTVNKISGGNIKLAQIMFLTRDYMYVSKYRNALSKKLKGDVYAPDGTLRLRTNAGGGSSTVLSSNAGIMYFRPNGDGNTTSEMTLSTNGTLTVPSINATSITSSLTGNATTATKLQTARNIAITGDASWNTNFDGSSDVTGALTLANSGVTAGTYKSVTVDSKGRVTAGSNPTTLLGYGITDAIPVSQKGVANGIATLDSNGLVPASQLPSYVDDVLEFNNLASFPTTGEAGKIYVALNTNLTYRWGGSSYTQIASGAVQSVNGQTGVVNLSYSDVGAEQVFTKNTAFNKNFGTSSNTVAQGDDSRILNGQTAYNWGNHADAGYVVSGWVYSNFQSLNNNLTGISDLNLTNRSVGLLKKISGPPGSNNWALDTSVYATESWTSTNYFPKSNLYGINITNTGGGAWIDMPTGEFSAIGSGGQGVDAWIAKTVSNGQFFTDAIAGDLISRNTTGKIMWGNSISYSAMYLQNNILTFLNTPKVGNNDIYHSGNFSLNGYATETWVTNQGYITANDVPPVYNGRINYTGVGAIEGGGASTANQSVNTHYSFDLTQATKNNINNGVTAYGWGDHSSAGYVKVSGDFIHDGTVSDYDLSTDRDTYLHNISIESSNGLNVLNLSNRHTLTIRNSNSASCPIKINSGSTFSINGYSTYVFYMTDAGKIIVTELVTTSEYT